MKKKIMSTSALPSLSSPRLRRQAESKLKGLRLTGISAGLNIDPSRRRHERLASQNGREVQNAELKEVVDHAECALEKYTALYEFAPVGYFSLDELGAIIEVNVSGAALIGLPKRDLLHRRLQGFVVSASRRLFHSFLGRVFAGSEQQVAEFPFLNEQGVVFLANLQAVAVHEPSAPWCRLALSDITALRSAEDTQRQLAALTAINQELEQEITRRHAVEAALTESQNHQKQLLRRAEQMQDQLRNLSHLILTAQEEERRRISRELHDEVLQTLVGINMHLENLSHCSKVEPTRLRRKIVTTQRLVTESVNAVHRFARELRPMILDDLGLIPALDAYIADFRKRTRIAVQFTAYPEVERLSTVQRVVLYRVVQAALCNVARHARARRAKVRIHHEEETIYLSIRDNGRSFDVERILNVKRYKRLGLLGMRERVEMVGGRFFVDSAPGKGTTIRVEIPNVEAL